MVRRRNSLKTQEPGAEAPTMENPDGEWVNVRKAAKDAGLSVPRIYQLAYGPDPPFEWEEHTVGRIRREIRIRARSLREYIARREADAAQREAEKASKMSTRAARTKSNDRGRQLASPPAC
jgi:hypothetical protein